MNYLPPENIPWMYAELPNLRTWRWRTERFDSYIQTEPGTNTYSLQVTDLSNGVRTVILNDIETSFKDAEESIAVFVARAYPRHEYGKYAGDAALTFKIRSGKKINFGPYEGTPGTRIEYVSTGGLKKIITGALQVNHHSIEITTEDRTKVKIPPQLITDVRGEYDARGGKQNSDTHRSDRTAIGNWGTGCTGRPGFKQNTVEHDPSTQWCPLHRV